MHAGTATPLYTPTTKVTEEWSILDTQRRRQAVTFDGSLMYTSSSAAHCVWTYSLPTFKVTTLMLIRINLGLVSANIVHDLWNAMETQCCPLRHSSQPPIVLQILQ